MGTLCSIDSGSSNAQDAVDDAPYVLFDRSKKVKRSTRYLFDCEALIIPGEGTEFLPRHFVGKFDLHQRAYALHSFSDRIDVKYLYYYLIYSKDYFPRVAVGATVKSLRRRHFVNLPVVLAPRDEQQRIVAILEGAFAGLATATANAEKNLKNVRELFESYLAKIMSPEESWEKSTLERLVSKTQIGLVRSLKEQGDSKPFAYVKMNNITTANQFDGSVIARVSATAKEVEAFSLKQNDFLFNTRNSRELVGKSCIYEADDKVPALFNNNIIRMQFNDVLDARFCAYAFQIESTKAQLEAIKSGTTNVAAIYWNKLKDLTIRYPDVIAQREIVGELRSLSLDVEKLRDSYENKIAQLSELKQSILQKAFSGELTSPPLQAIEEAAE